MFKSISSFQSYSNINGHEKSSQYQQSYQNIEGKKKISATGGIIKNGQIIAKIQHVFFDSLGRKFYLVIFYNNIGQPYQSKLLNEVSLNYLLTGEIIKNGQIIAKIQHVFFDSLGRKFYLVIFYNNIGQSKLLSEVDLNYLLTVIL